MSRGAALTKESFNRAAKQLERLNTSIKGRVPSGLRIIGEEIMVDVKASRPGRGVPVDKGTLRSTGRVEGPNGLGQVELSFGGAAAPYALVQHEDLSFHHTVGEARYLVRGVERWQAHGLSVSKALAELKAAVDAVAQRAATAKGWRQWKKGWV